MGATTLLKVTKLWAATLVLAAALAISGAAFAQDSGHGPSGPSGPGSNGPTFRPGADTSGACDVGLALPSPPLYGDGGDAVKALSRATESYIRECQCATQACIADALDQYAAALAEIAPRLPPQFQNEASVVAAAAQKVRAARTKAQATRALRDAIAIIHKDVLLVRAEEPDDPRLTRGGDFVAETLNVASLALENGGGL